MCHTQVTTTSPTPTPNAPYLPTSAATRRGGHPTASGCTSTSTRRSRQATRATFQCGLGHGHQAATGAWARRAAWISWVRHWDSDAAHLRKTLPSSSSSPTCTAVCAIQRPTPCHLLDGMVALPNDGACCVRTSRGMCVPSAGIRACGV
jgi:hypothetical protein